MALSSTIHHATLDLSDVDRDCYRSERLTLALHPSETPERMVARLLTWCLHQGDVAEALEFSAGLSTPNEPDLRACSLQDRVTHWIDMGEPDADRVRRACLRADRVTVVAYGRSWQQWWKRHERDLLKHGRAAVEVLPWDALVRLADNLPRSFNWQVTVSDGSLYVVDHRQQMETLIPERLKERAG
ncbi:YaeQ family protein [Isoalcanivorax beigongshangi]|uniref:YaeQ family protein n=1 Tax=Isoalcanivorax beigongshangi TaxID=3238810 RepID=A0ABV4AG73_9GAMM